MKKPILSIFTPVYNGEKYLEKCIESILNQRLQEFELYLYDDGSTDNSYDICRKYSDLDSRVHLLKGENGTSITAMNDFVYHAEGDYIAFVDNDDFVGPNYFSEMYQELIIANADCAVASYSLIDSGGQSLPWYTPDIQTGEELSGIEACRRFLTSLDIEGFRWNKLYRKTVFTENHISFKKTFPADMLVEFELLSVASKVVMVGNKEYYYRQSEYSEVGSMNSSKMMGMLNKYKAISEKAFSLGLRTEGQYYIVWRSIHCMFNHLKSRSRYNEEDWARVKKECTWNRWVAIPLIDALKVLRMYKNPKDSYFKFAVKAILVRLYFKEV